MIAVRHTDEKTVFYPAIHAASVNGGFIVVGPAQLDGCPRECDHGKIVAGPYLTYYEAEVWIRQRQETC